MPRVLVPFAGGFEEIETATLVDVLRRAGIEVVLASVSDGAGDGEPLVGARKIGFIPDAPIEAVRGPWDLVAIPGGLKSAEALARSEAVLGILAAQRAAGGPVAAICAGPLALDSAGLLQAGEYTCFPGVEESLSVMGRRDEPVVEYDGVITSQGPGTAMAFALHLVGRISGAEAREKVAKALLFS